MVTTQPISTAVSTERPEVQPDPDYVQRTMPNWIRATAKVFAYYADVYLKMGACFGAAFSFVGKTEEAKKIGITTAIVYGIAAFGKSFLPLGYRSVSVGKSGENTGYHRSPGVVKEEMPMAVKSMSGKEQNLDDADRCRSDEIRHHVPDQARHDEITIDVPGQEAYTSYRGDTNAFRMYQVVETLNKDSQELQIEANNVNGHDRF